MGVMELRRRIMLNEPHIVTPTSASVQNFKTDVIAPLKECKVHFAPMQEGAGDPSPENVRPITGWTGCKVWRTGKNLIDESYLANGNSYPNSGSYGYYYTDDIQLAPSTRYRFVWYNYDNTALTELGKTSINLYVSGASEYIVNNASYRQYSSGFITPATGIIRLGIYHPSSLQRQDVLDAIFNNGKLLLQVGTDNVTYTPYTGTTLPLDWTDSAGTVYGGYVDLVKGEVWETWVRRDISTMSSITAPTSQNFPWNHTFSLGNWITGWEKANGIDNFVADCFERKASSTGVSNYQMFGVSNTYNIYVYDDTITTAAEFREKYAGHYIAYETRYPTIVTTLTPTTLKTLRGTNNIWSNANGNIDLKYWTH